MKQANCTKQLASEAEANNEKAAKRNKKETIRKQTQAKAEAKRKRNASEAEAKREQSKSEAQAKRLSHTVQPSQNSTPITRPGGMREAIG